MVACLLLPVSSGIRVVEAKAKGTGDDASSGGVTGGQIPALGGSLPTNGASD